MSWLEISAVSIACIWGVLGWFLIRTLLAAKAALERLNQTLSQVQHTLEETAEPSKQLLHSSLRLTEEAHGRVKSLQRLFDSIDGAGTAVDEAVSTFRKASSAVAQSVLEVQRVVHSRQKRAQNIIEWAETGIELWHRWRLYRRPEPNSSESGTTR